MAYIHKLRYILSLLIALILVFVTVAPLADGGISLKVFERQLRVKPNHRLSGAAVCNVTDKASTNYDLIGIKLPSNVIFKVNPSVPNSISGSLSTIVDNSFTTWAATTGLTFSRGADTSTRRSYYDGQNIIAWNRLSRSTLGATYLRYNPATGIVVDVDTILNSRHPWSWTNPENVNEDQTCSSFNAYDAQNILVHELGHWIGLDDKYGPDDEDLTMFGYGSKGELKKDTLESGDHNGAAAIY